MQTLRYLIVDDNELDQIAVQAVAAAYPQLQHCGTAADALEGISRIKSVKPDVLFMDVDMPGASGIDVLRATQGIVPVNILITSHPEFALEGFELQVLDYVLKPLTQERFAQTARRISEYWEMKEKANAYSVLFEKEFLTIKDGHDRVRIPLHDVIYLEAMNNYTKIITTGKKHMVLSTLGSFLEQLPEDRFLRVHRSYVVARDKITRLQGSEVCCGNFSVPVGRTYRQAIAQWEL